MDSSCTNLIDGFGSKPTTGGDGVPVANMSIWPGVKAPMQSLSSLVSSVCSAKGSSRVPSKCNRVEKSKIDHLYMICQYVSLGTIFFDFFVYVSSYSQAVELIDYLIRYKQPTIRCTVLRALVTIRSVVTKKTIFDCHVCSGIQPKWRQISDQIGKLLDCD